MGPISPISPISLMGPIGPISLITMEDSFNIHTAPSQGEKDFENALRPLTFSDFAGQKKVVENLHIFVEAAKYRGEPLDHTLLHGPPGLE